MWYVPGYNLMKHSVKYDVLLWSKRPDFEWTRARQGTGACQRRKRRILTVFCPVASLDGFAVVILLVKTPALLRKWEKHEGFNNNFLSCGYAQVLGGVWGAHTNGKQLETSTTMNFISIVFILNAHLHLPIFVYLTELLDISKL